MNGGQFCGLDANFQIEWKMPRHDAPRLFRTIPVRQRQFQFASRDFEADFEAADGGNINRRASLISLSTADSVFLAACQPKQSAGVQNHRLDSGPFTGGQRLNRVVFDFNFAQDWMGLDSAFAQVRNQIGDRLSIAANDNGFVILLNFGQQAGESWSSPHGH